MTVDASPRYALASAHIMKYYSGDHHSSPGEPLHTITTKDRNALVESHLCIFHNNEDCRQTDLPLPTITASGMHFADVKTHIEKYDPERDLGNWPQVRDLLNKYCGYSLADDEILLLEIDGENYFIVDITLRMLEPKELYAAQGFPADYIIDHDDTGKPYSRKEQVARCGNAVPPPFAEALVRANLPEYCGDKIHTMHDLKERQAV